MLTVTILIVFGISIYCQGHPYSHDHAINSNIQTKPAIIGEYQGEEWIAENEGREGAYTSQPAAMRPDNNGGYVQNWEPLTKDHHYDPIAHAAAPPQKVTPVPNSKPYYAIGRLSKALCTGTFVAPRAILTAAHCVFENGKYIDPGKFQRRKDCNTKGAFSYTPVKAFVPSDYEKNEKRADVDYAIIITKEASSYWYGDYAAKSDKNINLLVVGYPDADSQKCMWESTCQLYRNGASILYYPCKSKPGMSGGPIFDRSTGTIIGIHVTGDDGTPPIAKNDSGVRITCTVRDTIRNWINKNGGNKL